MSALASFVPWILRLAGFSMRLMCREGMHMAVVILHGVHSHRPQHEQLHVHGVF